MDLGEENREYAGLSRREINSMPLEIKNKKMYKPVEEGFKVLLPDGKLQVFDTGYIDMGYRFSRVVNGKSVGILVTGAKLGEQTNTLRLNRGRFASNEDEMDDVDLYGVEYGNLTPERMKEVLKEILVKQNLNLSGIRQIHDESQIADGMEYIWISEEAGKRRFRM